MLHQPYGMLTDNATPTLRAVTIPRISSSWNNLDLKRLSQIFTCLLQHNLSCKRIEWPNWTINKYKRDEFHFQTHFYTFLKNWWLESTCICRNIHIPFNRWPYWTLLWSMRTYPHGHPQQFHPPPSCWIPRNELACDLHDSTPEVFLAWSHTSCWQCALPPWSYNSMDHYPEPAKQTGLR